MPWIDELRSTWFVGWTFCALVVGTGAVAAPLPSALVPAVAASTDPAQLLKQADGLKSANNAEFIGLLKRLDSLSPRLTQTQQTYLRYLEAWQAAYVGDFATAIPQLNAIIDDSRDVTLRFRAGVTAVNVLAIARRYEQAYARLNQMLDLLPQVSDPDARRQGLSIAAFLYNQAGQYDLGLSYANKVLVETPPGTSVCKGMQLKLEALYRSGKLQTIGNEFQNGVDACMQAGEPIFTGLIRTFIAKSDIAQGKYNDAIKLLQTNYDEVQRTHYPEVMEDVDSALAKASWEIGDSEQAQHYAQRVIDGGIKNEYTEPLVDAYEVLYRVAQKQGDYQAALAYHEKYAVADKGYLNDTTARTLAYQMVKQQVQEKKLQVNALNKQNQVLRLKQAVSAKTVEASRLTLLLLLTVLGSIAVWAYRTKLSQLKFMQLSRRDGLTGISNRHYFVDTAEIVLSLCKKSSQDACVVVLDLDHFKAVNDAHGHAMGDLVLKCAVSACEAHLRAHDLFGRIGGEEFAILMPDCIATTARQIAEKVRNAIAECHGNVDELTLPVHASFGIAASRTSGYELRQLLAHADDALYQAKREGRNRVVVHDHTKTDGLTAGTVDRRRM